MRGTKAYRNLVPLAMVSPNSTRDPYPVSLVLKVVKVPFFNSNVLAQCGLARVSEILLIWCSC